MITIQYEPDHNQAAAYDHDRQDEACQYYQVGVCHYRALPDRWIIDHTFTDPAYTGRGIARRMVERVAEQAACAQVKLEATCWYARKVLDL